MEQNFERGHALIQALFACHSRLNVIRIDLEYLREHLPSLEQAKHDFNRLLNNSRFNAIFKDIVGYIWRLEWAPDTGWHWHVMFFVDDSKRDQDWYIAQQIGQYWCSVISGGRGRMHNCNANKEQYDRLGRLGIGTIWHGDYDKRDVLVNVVLRYFAKVDEHLCVPVGTRTFGTSQMPRPHSGLGRPRWSSLVSEVSEEST